MEESTVIPNPPLGILDLPNYLLSLFLIPFPFCSWPLESSHSTEVRGIFVHYARQIMTPLFKTLRWSLLYHGVKDRGPAPHCHFELICFSSPPCSLHITHAGLLLPAPWISIFFHLRVFTPISTVWNCLAPDTCLTCSLHKYLFHEAFSGHPT